MNNTLIWPIFFIVSITLILTLFEFNSNSNVQDTIKVGSNVLFENDLNTIEIIIKKHNLSKAKNINGFDKKLRKLLINNIRHHQRYNIEKIEKQTIISAITNNSVFKNNGTFNFNLYKNFLNIHNCSEYNFQHFIKRKLQKKNNEKINTYLTAQTIIKKYNTMDNLSCNNRQPIKNTLLIEHDRPLFHYLLLRPLLFYDNIETNNEIILEALLKNKKLYKKPVLINIDHLKLNKKNKMYNNIRMLLNNTDNLKLIFKNKSVKKNITLTNTELHSKFKYNLQFIDNFILKENETCLHIIRINKYNTKNTTYNYKDDVTNKYIKLILPSIKDKALNILLKLKISELLNIKNYTVLSGFLPFSDANLLLKLHSNADIILEKQLIHSRISIEKYIVKYLMQVKYIKSNIILNTKNLKNKNINNIYLNIFDNFYTARSGA